MTSIKQKVFCIGFHKTGTTSLASALTHLGYRVAGNQGVDDPDIANKVQAIADALVGEYDAFEDNPWPILFKELDRKYPGNRFILTLRSPESWIQSQLKHFGSTETPMRQWIYGVGCPQGNEEIYLKRFEAHNREVLEYFQDRPNDLLVMDFTKGDGWEKLCDFLDVEVPDIPFPHFNKASDREQATQFRAKLTGKLKKVLRLLTNQSE